MKYLIILATIYVAAVLQTSETVVGYVPSVMQQCLITAVCVVVVMRQPGMLSLVLAALMGLTNDLLSPGAPGIAIVVFTVFGLLVHYFKPSELGAGATAVLIWMSVIVLRLLISTAATLQGTDVNSFETILSAAVVGAAFAGISFALHVLGRRTNTRHRSSGKSRTEHWLSSAESY